jgi:hypothetical protein
MSLVSRIRSRLAAIRHTQDRGTMSMVMLVVIIGMGLAALTTPLVVSQSQSTSRADTRVQALHQAESGIDAMLGRFRNATDADGVTGKPSKLPCSELAWSVASPATGYRVTAQYYTSDPQSTTAVQLLCTDGTGPYDPVTSAATVPGFARITSTGLDGTGKRASSRTLLTTYAFNTVEVATSNSTPDSNVGGLIRLDPNAFFDIDETECLAASGSIPDDGMPLSVQACSSSTPADKAQLFFYYADLSLRLAQTITETSPGLCVTAPTTGTAVTLTPCLGMSTAAPNQQWSLDANGAFVRAAATSVCMAVRATGTDIVTKTCLGTYDSTAAWLPTTAVGAGAAGATNGQLLNFSQFGQCASVADSSLPASPPSTLIVSACEQTTSPALVSRVQKFTYDSNGRWVTKNAAGTDYCLTSHGLVSPPVTVETCGTSPSQKWTDYGAAAGTHQENASQWAIGNRYTIVDLAGLCLSLSPTSGSNANSTVTTATCDASARQKWNAGPQSQPAKVKDTTEK